MTRPLTEKEITILASRKGVKKIAVENFLLSLPLQNAEWMHYENLDMDARLYNWNSATQNAIRKGIQVAYGQGKITESKPKISQPKSKELKKYKYKHEGSAMSDEIYAHNIADAKKRYKEKYKLKRLPNGFEIWQP